MQTSDVTPDRLQRLATYSPGEGRRVLSLYLNLDPHANFGAPVNRRSAVNSLLDEAARAVEGEESLEHDAHMALRADVTRAREQLDANLDDNWAEGAHALALFVCGPGDLFEVLRLPRPVESRVTIADRPAIEPLALLRTDETHREREALDRVGASGVRGIVDVLPALYERRVATLLIEPGIEHRGVVCPRCRWALAEERGTCPVDGETMVEHPNLIEWAVELAVAQDAEVLSVRRHDDLADHGGIAAALRF